MSSETDHPRQRTVAELLAEHGVAGAPSGRRRRRRESDGDNAPVDGRSPAPPPAPAPPVDGRTAPVNGTGVAPAAWAFPPPGPDRPAPDRPASDRPVSDRPVSDRPVPDRSVPDRSILRKPVPQDFSARDDYVAPDLAPRAYVPEPEPRPAPPRRNREIPTEHLPRYREERTVTLDPSLTGPIERLGPDLDEPTLDSDAGDPAGGGAEGWHRPRTRSRSGDGGPATRAAVLPEFGDDRPAGLDEDDVEEPRRRLGRSAGAASPGQAWAAVVAQWIVGAVGGAALWVGFRFLWRELPVVALAAAVLVTVGLVLVVRALLRNSDMRTTVFAVLVGLLLTVSPAILVLLGR